MCRTEVTPRPDQAQGGYSSSPLKLLITGQKDSNGWEKPSLEWNRKMITEKSVPSGRPLKNNHKGTTVRKQICPRDSSIGRVKSMTVAAMKGVLHPKLSLLGICGWLLQGALQKEDLLGDQWLHLGQDLQRAEHT